MPSPQLSPKPRKRMRVRYSNRVKILACYSAALAAPPLWLTAGLLVFYPYRLIGSAPTIAQNLLTAFPMLSQLLAGPAALASTPASLSPPLWEAALVQRDHQWIAFLLAAFALSWVVTWFIQLFWRFTHARPHMVAQSTARAIRDYRLSQTLIWLLNGALAAAVWLLGVQFIQGRTLWDYLIYFVPYGLNGLAALCCFRLAAPPILSGRRAFFKRL